ncbi:anti-anti-sigma factor [Streptomyces sp. MnatMP-M77]|uniref:STAS domain-containing protein n=1 Tax=unclassified Streptomyces TaxID=2593676 RepID=UPI000805D3C9|nr:STAS domain-containing protein [Streptomyces sp. MnatMP-M77]MYT79314.1 STAS domain-containing protein [Streptomyces sp. SID8364]SBV03887.1 anti-anti-sigma factor [Streptomyces sp. MnatMP-M77]
MSSEPHRSLATLSPSGEFDLHNVTSLGAEIEMAAAVNNTVLLDASKITFGDSSFLRVILDFHHRTDLRIVSPSPRVARLFALAGVDTFLQIYPTPEAARTAS